MKRREFITLLGGAAAAWPLAAHAQQAGKRPTIGLLVSSTPADESQRVGAFNGCINSVGSTVALSPSSFAAQRAARSAPTRSRLSSSDARLM